MGSSEELWKDRFVFPSLFEGLKKSLGERFTPGLKAKLKVAGLDLDDLPPAIPALEMGRLLRIIGEEIWPEKTCEEQLRLLGLSAIRGWRSGLLGSAASKMLQLVGPRGTLTRLDRVFATTNNFSKATTTFLSETEALITINDVQDMPTYWCGIFDAGLELLGLVGTVTIEAQRTPEATLRISWK